MPILLQNCIFQAAICAKYEESASKYRVVQKSFVIFRTNVCKKFLIFSNKGGATIHGTIFQKFNYSYLEYHEIR
jgi:hypothetical protein